MKVVPFLFKGGEVHLRLLAEPNRKSSLNISPGDYTMNGFMAICEHAEIYRRFGGREIHILYPYFPYARQDRVMEPLEPFSLKIFCDLVNSQNFTSVTIWDPHSDVTPALLNNCIVVPQWEIVKKVVPEDWLADDVLLISPDAGAYKKVAKLTNDDSRIAIGVKVRNGKGEITHTDVFSRTPIAGRRCLIVDDICDGGRTFTALAEKLWEDGAREIGLYVTHGIFSRGFDCFKERFARIFTTNSFVHENVPDFVTVKEIA